MKIVRCKFLMIALMVIVCMGSCSDDEAKIPKDEENSKQLAGTWVLGSSLSKVEKDGKDITSQYANFSIFFTEQFGYFAQGDPNNLIQPEGTWKYAEGDFGKILLNNDDRPITITINEDQTALTLTFSNDNNKPIGSSRVNGITGSYTFILSKK